MRSGWSAAFGGIANCSREALMVEFKSVAEMRNFFGGDSSFND